MNPMKAGGKADEAIRKKKLFKYRKQVILFDENDEKEKKNYKN